MKEYRQINKESIEENTQFVIILIIRITFVVTLLLSIFLKKEDTFVPAALGTFFIFLPEFVRKILELQIIPELNLFFILFVFAAIFLGEIRLYYEKIWWWDIMLHFISGVLLGLIGFSLVYFLNYSESVNVSPNPFFIALFSFCFAIMCGVIWEIIEFGVDQLFGTNTQRSGLMDTMGDLIADTGGAFFTAILGYLYLNKGYKSRMMMITMKFIRKMTDSDIQFMIFRINQKRCEKIKEKPKMD
jgi:hypothetical protein